MNYFQNDWVDLLPMAKFAANANFSAFTKILPFQTMREYVLEMSFDSVDLLEELIRKKLANSKVWLIAINMEEV